MTVVIPEDGNNDQADDSAQAAAVAEGAAGVRAEQAAEAAEDATVAAELAVSAARANEETAAGTAEAAMIAENSATEAGAARDAVLVALNAQTAALSSLTEELRLQREGSQQQAAAPVTPTKRTPDRAPAKRGKLRDRYYGKG